MTVAVASEPMARKAAPPPPEPEPDRVTIINLKGSPAERDHLKRVSRNTGVPISEIVRRGSAMWMKSRGEGVPEGWEGK